MISIVVPTVEGREHWLRECLTAYAAHTPEPYEVIVEENHPACGPAWVAGAEKAAGDYLHFSADDLVPHAGWLAAAKHTANMGFLPAPRILNPDGSLQTCGGSDEVGSEFPTGWRTDFSRIPFLSRTQWEKIGPRITWFLEHAHYFTDNAVSWAGSLAGYATVVNTGYLFTHGFAQEKRGAGMSEPERMVFDHRLFKQLVA